MLHRTESLESPPCHVKYVFFNILGHKNEISIPKIKHTTGLELLKCALYSTNYNYKNILIASSEYGVEPIDIVQLDEEFVYLPKHFNEQNSFSRELRKQTCNAVIAKIPVVGGIFYIVPKSEDEVLYINRYIATAKLECRVVRQ